MKFIKEVAGMYVSVDEDNEYVILKPYDYTEGWRVTKDNKLIERCETLKEAKVFLNNYVA